MTAPWVTRVAAMLAVATVACGTAPPASQLVATAPSSSSRSTSPPSARPVEERGPPAEHARALITAALVPAAEQRWQQRRALTFVEGGARFALDDAWSLVAQAPRPRRAAILAAMAPALAARAAIAEQEQALVVAAAGDAHTTAPALVARRVGLEERALAALVTEVLRATEELLGPVAADVTLVPDVLAPPPWRARGAPSVVPAGPRALATDWALHYGDVPRPPSPDDAAAFGRALTVELRLAALSLQALAVPPLEHDALASRALVGSADVVVGAAALLDLDASGAVVERFVGLLRAPMVTRARWANEPLAPLVARLDHAPPPDEEGYPEAYVAVVRLLPELHR